MLMRVVTVTNSSTVPMVPIIYKKLTRGGEDVRDRFFFYALTWYLF